MIKVINECNEHVFESTVNEYLSKGYKISSTSCGFLNSEEYEFVTNFQAILFKEVSDD
ncbi:MAG TPA: hypothetical protein GX707_13925 [Epulopiscium sp.]|nr:hypothetical protein [Candidatus Epulonipiscium sp.]